MPLEYRECTVFNACAYNLFTKKNKKTKKQKNKKQKTVAKWSSYIPHTWEMW